MKWSAAVALLLGFLLGSIVAGSLTGVVAQSTAEERARTPAVGPVGPDTVMAGVYVTNIQSVDRTTRLRCRFLRLASVG